MEVSRIERSLDETPRIFTFFGSLMAFAIFGNIVYNFAASFSYQVLCALWLTSVCFVYILIRQWDTLPKRAFGVLGNMIGRENTVMILLTLSILFSLMIPFAVMYKCLFL